MSGIVRRDFLKIASLTTLGLFVMPLAGSRKEINMFGDNELVQLTKI